MSLIILLYHGVTKHLSEGIENISGKHIKSDLFFEQMKILKANCHLLSMDDVLSHITQKKPFPENATAVTFDDGFENNYTVARPILEEHEIPATFYLTTGMISNSKLFWVDQLEGSLNHTIKKSINIQLGPNLKKYELSSLSSKSSALKDIKLYCKGISSTEKTRIVSQVIEETEVIPNIDMSPNYRMMNWEMIKEMNQSKLFTFGGHNVEHEILSALPTEKMEWQIKSSIETIEDNLHTNVIHYAYPEGQENHFNNKVIEILKFNGIMCCPSAINGVNTIKDDLFKLKRVMVGMNNIKFPYC